MLSKIVKERDPDWVPLFFTNFLLPYRIKITFLPADRYGITNDLYWIAEVKLPGVFGG